MEGSAREVARDRAEAHRLAYVAATRARDLLVVPVVGDSPVFPDGGWLAPIQKAIAPPEDLRPERAEGCPRFGRDTVIRGPDAPGPTQGSLTPGTYRLASGARVTVWDPAVLDLEDPLPRGLRGVQLVEERDVDPAVVTEGRAALETFRAARAEALAAGSRPTEVVVTATAQSHVAGEDEAAVDVVIAALDPASVALERVQREPGRPSGTRFGDLVHQLLATATAGEALEAEARVRSRALGLDEATAAAAVRAVQTAVTHPLLVAAARAAERGECRREQTLSHALGGNRVLEGVVDLAFREDGRWTVVDFKTDVVLGEERRLAYARQVALYVKAIEAATGEPAQGALLLV